MTYPMIRQTFSRRIEIYNLKTGKVVARFLAKNEIEANFKFGILCQTYHLDPTNHDWDWV